MTSLKNASVDFIRKINQSALDTYNKYQQKNIALNMARGKPAPAQLALSDEMLNLTKDKLGIHSADGTDCRNYGVLAGIPECRALFGELLGVSADNVIACGSSSLNLMFDYFSQCYTHGVSGCTPWSKVENPKFIAVVPGYDRHFAIAQYFGFTLINVKNTPYGPDMDEIERLVKDSSVKGIFCVPKYSNPDGVTYSAQTVKRLAALKPAAKDFRVFWDEAYIIHDLYEQGDELINVFEEAKKYQNEDNFIAFASTSKISFAGAGVSVLACSDNNIKEILKRMTVQIISYDKLNQLRHCYFYHSVDDLKKQMAKHAQILRPKFDTVLSILHRELDGLGIAEWSEPKGGYFISLNVKIGSAKYVGQLCKECGLTLTGIGATYPYGIDPADENIRIAPSYPELDEIVMASEIICACVKLAACKELLKA